MKNRLLFTILTILALSACQDNQAPESPAPAEPGATAPQQPARTASRPDAVSKQAEKLPVKSAVAVTKPEPAGTANTLRQAMKQPDAAQPVTAAATAETIQKAVTKVASGSRASVVSQGAKVAKQPVKRIKNAAPEKAIKQAVKKAPKAVASPVAASAGAQHSATSGDVARGKKIARKCQGCHNFTDKKKVGPGLKGVFGRRAGIMPDMRYSKALKAGGWVWNEKNLHLWDCDSRNAIKVLTGNPSAKTKMPPQHICDAAKLADLTAFLKTL